MNDNLTFTILFMFISIHCFVAIGKLNSNNFTVSHIDQFLFMERLVYALE